MLFFALYRYNAVVTQLAKLFSTAKVPSYQDRTKLVSLEPELTLALAESRDEKELRHYWVQWRDATGKRMPK